MKNNIIDIPILKTNKYYSTQELSQLFKANESTIKRWADSGKLKCFKTPGGHRKFTSEHVSEFIANYQYEIISQQSVPSINQDQGLLETLIQKEDYLSLSEMMYSAAASSHKDKIFTILKECHYANVPLISIYDEIVRRVITKTLSLRSEGKVSFVEEQIVKISLTESLFQFKLLSQRVIFKDQVAITCSAVAGIHEAGLMCAEHLLEVAGWKVFSLGNNVAMEEITGAIENNNPHLLCLSADFLSDHLASRDIINSLRTTTLKHGTRLLFAEFEDTKSVKTDRQSGDMSLSRFHTFTDMFSFLYDKK